MKPEEYLSRLYRERKDALLCDKAEKRRLELQNQKQVFLYIAEFHDRYIDRSPFFLGVLEELHRLTVADIYPCSGNIRRHWTEDVHVTGASFSPTTSGEVEAALVALVEQARTTCLPFDLPSDDFSIENTFQDIWTQTEIVVKLFHEFMRIHPFQGWNGRVGRAFLHLMLYEMGLVSRPQQIFDYMEQRRERYISSLKRADAGNFEPLTNYIFRAVIELGLFQALSQMESQPWLLKRLGRDLRRFLLPDQRQKVPDEQFVKLLYLMGKTLDSIYHRLAMKQSQPS